MKTEASKRCRQTGFSLVEMMVVVAIVMIMAAVALPNISQYMRTYTIRGGSQAFAGEMQSARSKGIMSNTNAGVSLVVVDRDSYRWVMEDLPSLAEQLGPLHDLPTGVEFEPTTAANSGPSVRFNRLGSFCNPGDASSGCATAAATVCSAPELLAGGRCAYGTGLNFVEPLTLPSGSVEVTLHERQTDLRTTVRLVPGGRVYQNPGWETP
jgi:prepilin-type N-terminal cleavage/methylation domain-containing protein